MQLEQPTLPLEVSATLDAEGVTSPGASLPLTLSNEAGAQLGVCVTGTTGRCRFNPAASALGPPGRGELRVGFPGNSEIGAATLAVRIERRTKVDLTLPQATASRLPAGGPEEGIGLQVEARGRADSAAATGSIEARVGDTIVGAAPLIQGKANVVVTFATPGATEVPLRIRYVSDTPWYEALPDVVVTLPVHDRSLAQQLAHQLPLLVAGAAVVAWLVLGRARLRSRREKAPTSRRPPLQGEARVEVVGELAAGSGWKGRVVDAHEGDAIAGARVAIERPGFQGTQTLASTTADEHGAFELAHVPTDEGASLLVEAPLHASLRQSVPGSGELAIALVLRKRALLNRLVAWARRRGKPFESRPGADSGTRTKGRRG